MLFYFSRIKSITSHFFFPVCYAKHSLTFDLSLDYLPITDLSMRVDSVKEENLKLRSENQVLSQYIENLMSASNVFQSTSPNKTSSGGKKKGKK